MRHLKKPLSIIILATLLYNIPLFAPLFTINRPGIFSLGDNLIGIQSNDSVIQITSSNVILDLGERTITQNSGLTGITGITVNPNLSNITIRNGTINSLTGTGIVINEGCSNILIEEVQTSSCDTRGIAAVGTVALPIDTITIQNCQIDHCCRGTRGDYGVYLKSINIFFLNNIDIASCGAITTNNMSGLRIDGCIGGHVEKINLNGLVGSTNVRGLDISNTQNMTFENCEVSTFFGLSSGTLVVGYELQSTTSCTGIELINCGCLALTSTLSSGRTIGFRIGSTCTQNNIIDCRILANTANGSTNGIVLDTTRNCLLTNVLSRNNTSNTGVAIGCFVTSCTNLRIFNCGFSTQSSLTSTAIGIDLEFSADCLFQSNTTSRNNGVTDATSYGFLVNPPGSGATPPAFNNVFTQNISTRNGPTSPISANQFSGFASGQQNTVANEAVNSIGQPWTNPGFI